MNILTVNKFYYVKGGSETYLFALEDQLKQLDYKVIPFAMHDERNKSSDYSKYFVNNINYSESSSAEKLKLAGKIIYSLEAKKNMERLLNDHQVDIAHIHLFQHQLSPSILQSLKKKKIPVIYTVHDLKVMCPNYKMLNDTGVCEQCKGGKFYNVLLNKCTKNSFSGSAVSMLEAYIHKIMDVYGKYIDHFVTPSNFYREKMIEWGFPAEKISFIPNFLNTNKFIPSYENEGYFLYLGRLSEEKGILTLLKAMNYTNPDITLKIAGTGPLTEQINAYIDSNNLRNRVHMLGFVSGNELTHLVQQSKCVVMPSEWYENGPLALIESLAYGKPVIGSNIGGIPEHIDDGINGMLFPVGSAKDLADRINEMYDLDLENYLAMCRGARIKAENEYDAKKHMEKLLHVYSSVMREPALI